MTWHTVIAAAEGPEHRIARKHAKNNNLGIWACAAGFRVSPD